MLAAFLYECSCGRRFVVGIDDDAVDAAASSWRRTLRRVATTLGADVVDANDRPVFTCPDCGQVHERELASPPERVANLPSAQ